MKSKLLLMGAAALTAGWMSACNDNHGSSGSAATPAPAPVAAPQTPSQSLDTLQVLALAQQTSESAAPFAVNGGALVLNDTNETGGPIPVPTM